MRMRSGWAVWFGLKLINRGIDKAILTIQGKTVPVEAKQAIW